jgi:hypothetical protein
MRRQLLPRSLRVHCFVCGDVLYGHALVHEKPCFVPEPDARRDVEKSRYTTTAAAAVATTSAAAAAAAATATTTAAAAAAAAATDIAFRNTIVNCCYRHRPALYQHTA